jgi:hypothetical protein
MASAVDGQDAPGSVDQRLKRIEEELEEQKRKNAELETRLKSLQGQPAAPGGAEDDAPAAPSGAPTLAEQAEALEGRYGSRGGIYSKPFLNRLGRTAYLGGYIDLEYIDSQDSDRRFTQHRFIPYIYVDATDRLRFAAEIEFEYGGSDAPGDDGETKVEFAVMDYHFTDWINFRAGAILVPLGKFNLIHDSPINDLTDRPLVNQFVIPTTFTEAGLGFFGELPEDLKRGPLEEWEIRYEAYMVNGFDGLDRDGSAEISEARGLRDARPSLRVDNNNSISGVGRVSISPFLGTELGSSMHMGKYDEAGDNWLYIWALDLLVQPGRFAEALSSFEILAEIAGAEIERNDLARSNGVPDELWGVYGQINYHFMFDWLKHRAPVVFGPESTFTYVTRLDHVELGGNQRERITFGLNFRPIPDTVFKFDYQLNFEEWHRDEVHNDAFLFSAATYF